MTDFQMVRGFEDVWAPPADSRRRTPEALIKATPGAELRARLTRLVNGAPQAIVKVAGRTRNQRGLAAHLDYISRNGRLPLEDRDGALLATRADARELVGDWRALALADSRRDADFPLGLSLVLSTPAGSEPSTVLDAARAFAQTLFADERDYVFTLHTDTPNPHVHLSLCARGDKGQGLSPGLADLHHWRQVFAEALRERGLEVEAAPRRARGVTRKGERLALRRMRELHENGTGAMARVRRAAYQDAARLAFKGETVRGPWEERLMGTQAKIRALYLAQAQLLSQSQDLSDRELGAKVEAFVRSMPAPDSQRLSMARELRAAARVQERARGVDGPERAR